MLQLRHAAGGPDYPDELLFWTEYFKSQPSTLHSHAVQAKAFPQELRVIADDLRARSQRKPKLLEVGSGPVSFLAAGATENLYEIVAIDPLAYMYRLLLKKHNLQYPIKPRLGKAENLRRYFDRGSFDVVYSSNALDHVVSPQHSLKEICDLLRPSGFLLLEGFVREGSHGGWEGLHQHDLFVENGHLIHVSQFGHHASLSAGLPLEPVSQNIRKFRDREISGFGYEIPEFPDGVPPEFKSWESRDWYTILFRRQ